MRMPLIIRSAGFARSGIARASLWLLCGWGCLIVSVFAAGPPPVITLHPQDQTVPLGGTALFTVEATSGTKLSYQWYFQATVIAGATDSTYAVTNAQWTNAGIYYVAVRNAGGTVNSSNASLTVNAAPVLSGANNFGAITEDNTTNGGTLVSSLMADKVTDPDPGAVQGIAVVAVNSANGTWQYSTNAGATWGSFGAPSTVTARLLAADANGYVRFVPAADWSGTVTNGLTFRAWDQTGGTNGGVANVTTNGGPTAFSTNTASSSILVSPVNDAPVANNQEVTASPATPRLITLTASDVENDPLTFALVTSPANGVVSGFDPQTGTLTYTPNDGFAGADSLSFQAHDGSTNSATAIVNIQVALLISGTVFEDMHYGGGAGGSRATTAGVGRPGARMELYSLGGNLITNTLTDANGNYSFSVAPSSDYSVRVVNGTVTSSRGGSGLIPVQTFRTTAASGAAVAVTDCVGGEDPTKSDAGNGSTTVAALTTSTTIAQSVAPVHVGAGNVTDLDFGFNFDTIVRTNNAGQGTLRQFILNANALAGGNTTIFMIADGNAHPGLRAGLPNQLTGPSGSQVARFVPTTALPALTDPFTMLDGSTQTENVGDHNLAVLGTGGTVGVDGLPLSQVAGPEVEIRDGASLANGIQIQADNTTVRGFAIYGFGASDGQGAIVIGDNVKEALVENNVLGSAAAAVADPGPTLRNWHGVYSAGADNGTIRSNLICFSGRIAVFLVATSTNWTVTGNEVRDSGTETTDGDGITVSSAPSNTISGNLITGSSSQGITVTGTGSAGNVFVNNTVRGNGVGTATGISQSTAITIRSTGGASLFDRNVVTGNYGAGLAVNSGANRIRLTRNSFFANGTITNRSGGGPTGQIGIDLNASTDDANLGTSPFVTSNELNDTDSGGNTLLNFPILDAATLTNGHLVLAGWARPGSIIEVFLADGDPRGFGEGKTYLGTMTEGSGDDSDSTSSTYGPGAINGLAQGTDNTSRFRCSLPAPPEVVGGEVLTATATDLSGNTSEFSGGVTLAATGADVAVRLAGPTIVLAGSTLTYSITVTNRGRDTATNLVVSDALPPGATLISASSGGTLSNGVVSWPTLAHFPNGATTNYTLTLTAPTIGPITNIVYGTAPTADPNLANNDGSAADARAVTLVFPPASLAGQLLPDGTFQMEVDTLPNTTCSFLASTNLVDWVTLVTTNSGTGFVQFIDQDAVLYPQRFYRSTQEP